MKLKSLFFYFSRDSRIARLHSKYDRLKKRGAQVVKTITTNSNPDNPEDWVAWHRFSRHEEEALYDQLHAINQAADMCRHKFLWLEYKQRGGFLLS